MHIISRKRLNEFAEVHLDAKPALVRWYRLASNRDFRLCELAPDVSFG